MDDLRYVQLTGRLIAMCDDLLEIIEARSDDPSYIAWHRRRIDAIQRLIRLDWTTAQMDAALAEANEPIASRAVMS